MTEQIRVAITGAGGIAKRHLENLRFLGGNQIVAICDLDLSRAQELAGKVGAQAFHTTDELFDAGVTLDALVICTPYTVRRQLIEQAAQRGIAVYCEKPPAHTVEEGLRVAEIIDRHNMICSVGFHQRYSPAVDHFRQLTAGRPANIVQSMALNPSAFINQLEPWFYIQERSGGQLMDQAIHTIDLLRFVVGEITEVHTFGSNYIRPKSDDFTVDDTTTSTFRFAHGGTGSHIHSWGAPKGRGKLLIIGEDYSLTLRAHSAPQVSGFLGGPGSEHTPVNETWEQGPPMGRFGVIPPERKAEDPPDPPHCGVMDAFLEAVRSGRTSGIRSSYLDSLNTLAVILGMIRSIKTGQVERIQPVAD